MRVSASNPLLTLVAGHRPSPASAEWRAGQILNAVVSRVSNVGTATLNVNNVAIDVRGSAPLIVGARLRLEVAQMGTSVTLRILPPPENTTLTDTVRQLLPRQESLAPLMARLGSLLTANAAQRPALGVVPPPLADAARQLFARIATREHVASPEGLRQAILNAGLFFERQLLTPQPPQSADIKGALLKLIADLRTISPRSSASALPAGRTSGAPPPGEPIAPAPLFDMLEDGAQAALARIVLQQLASLPRSEGDAPQWFLDLPFRQGEHVHLVRLHIYREKHPRDPKHLPAWCVRLSFDLVTLGPVSVLVTWFGGAASISLWAQRDDTARLFDAHLAALRTRLHDDGVPIRHMQCEHGTAPFAADPLHDAFSHTLVDEHI
jgi:hypothetical protein